MLATRAVTLLLVALVVAGPASAQIVIQDPAGDVELSGLPLGVAGSAYDLREIQIRQDGEHLLITIRLEAAPVVHDSAEFGVVFEGNGTWMAGYTALPYTNPAPHYRGGFVCPATADGYVNGSVAADCVGLESWSFEDNTYTILVPLGFVQAINGTVISAAWGYAEITPYLKSETRVDVTSRQGELVVRSDIGAASNETLPDRSDEQVAPVVPVSILLVAAVFLLGRLRGRRQSR